jgi:ATP-dependent helicase/nuclease subunit A
MIGRTASTTAGLDAVCEAAGRYEPPNLPKLSNALPGKDVAKSLIDSVRDELKVGDDSPRFCDSIARNGPRACASTHSSARVFLQLVEEFGRRYRAAKDAVRSVDFSDLERLALAALTENNRVGDDFGRAEKGVEKGVGAEKGVGSHLQPSAVARLLHKQFKHVLVDEYQDINEVQNAILTLASTECVADANTPSNLFCVGDVKQSIYRFRLAEPELFLARYRGFRNSTRATGSVIDLQANFRSRGPLLDSLNEVFGRLMTESATDIEYDASQRLNAGLKYPDANGALTFTGAPLELHLLPDDPTARDDHDDDSPQSAEEQDLERSEREALLIAQRILALTGKDGTLPPMHVMERIDGVFTPRPIRLAIV